MASTTTVYLEAMSDEITVRQLTVSESEPRSYVRHAQSFVLYLVVRTRACISLHTGGFIQLTAKLVYIGAPVQGVEWTPEERKLSFAS